MITLCMDTSHRFLTLVLLDEDNIIASFQQECFKRQSETALLELDLLFKKANIDKKDLGAVCITKGPGSYTGIRIAMTIAKMVCSMKDIPLYTLSSLRLYACAKKDATVLIDARSNRAYFAKYKDGLLMEGEKIVELSEIEKLIDDTSSVYGDRSLINLEDQAQDYALSFLNNKAYFEKAENVHLVVPEYLKENDDYMVKK